MPITASIRTLVAGYTIHPGIDNRKVGPAWYALGFLIAMATGAETVKLKDKALSDLESANCARR